MRRHRMLLITLAAWLLANSGRAATPPEIQNAKSPRPAEISVSVPYPQLIRLFNFPICTEHPRLYRTKNSNSLPITPSADEKFTVEQNETLSHVINRLLTLFPDQLERKDTNGFLTILCDKNAPNTSPNDVSTLDRKISFQVDGLSTWEAFKTLAHQLNSLPESKYPFIVQPVGTQKYESHRPNPSFTEDRVISIAMQNVTVRKIIAAIMVGSPTTIYYDFNPTDSRDSLMIYFMIDDSVSVATPPSPEDVEFWDNEFRELSESFLSAHPSR